MSWRIGVLVSGLVLSGCGGGLSSYEKMEQEYMGKNCNTLYAKLKSVESRMMLKDTEGKEGLDKIKKQVSDIWKGAFGAEAEDLKHEKKAIKKALQENDCSME